jgi:hypothetical protein
LFQLFTFEHGKRLPAGIDRDADNFLFMITRTATILLTSLLYSSIVCSQTTIINLTISEPARLIVDAGKDKSIDSGLSVTLGEDAVVTGGSLAYVYLWESGNSQSFQTKTIEVSNTGKYYLTVTDTRNCSATDSLNVGITGVRDVDEPKNIIVFPNPSQGRFSISLNNSNSPLNICIFSPLGRVIYSIDIPKISSPFIKEVELDHPIKGLYFIQITSGDGSTSTSSFVIN